MRYCKSCDTLKIESEFSYRGGGRKGLQMECKACSRERARAYRQRQRDKVADYKLQRGCEVCGFKAKHSCQLDLDHINPEEKTYKGCSKAYDSGWSWKRIKSELAKCVVTCKNCHALRTYEEGHWRNSSTDIGMRQSSAQT